MIYHDTKDGRNRYIVRVFYNDETGAARRKSRVAHSLKEAQKMEASMRAETRSGITDADHLTLPVLWSEYRPYSKARTKRTTFESYEQRYNTYILPFFGDRPLSDFSANDFRKWKDSLGEELTLTTRHTIYTVLHMVLRFGFKTHGCTAIQGLELAGDFKESPDTILMKKEEALHYWTPSEFDRFSSALRSFAEDCSPSSNEYIVRWGSFVLFNILFYAGLRRGEANALFVSDFHDGEQPYLDISKSVTHKVKGGGWFLTGPKNRASVRKVPIPNCLAKIINEHLERLARIPRDWKISFNKMYLCGGVAPVNDSSSDRMKEDIEDRLELPHIRVHDLRHSYVSVLINAGTPITTISKLVGHASTEMTWKVYSHLYPVTLSTAVDVFDSLSVVHDLKKVAENGSQNGSHR